METKEKSREIKYFGLGMIIALTRHNELKIPNVFETGGKRYIIKEKEA